jgi:putative DNA primase/helicase
VASESGQEQAGEVSVSDDPINLADVRAKKKRKPVPNSAEALMGLLLTDMGNAERFVRHWGGRVRFCHGRNKWLIWDKTRWCWDTNGRIERMAKVVVRELYQEAARSKDSDKRYQITQHARASEKTSSIANMLRRAQVEEGVPVALEDLDANPMLLNCLNGTIDLASGKLRPHAQKDLVTKICPCNFDPGAISGVWTKFLSDATNGDQDLQDYIQRAAGYAVQGEASERAMFFTFGPPGSAKSTLIDALASMLGDYHVASSPDTWLVQAQTGGNRGDLVRLAGARLVTAVEFKQGARFDEALIKGVTGGDPMTAAAKYESEVTVTPTFTLWFAANDSPTIRSDDDGMWARMRRIPFDHAIPKELQDKSIKARLKKDAGCRSAVLAWSVAGCLRWQLSGLGSSSAVDKSSKEYQAEMDPVGDFFDDNLVFESDAKMNQGDVRKLYGAWAKEEGVLRPLGRKQLQKAVTDRGGRYVKVLGKRVVKGVREKGEWEQSSEQVSL